VAALVVSIVHQMLGIFHGVDRRMGDRALGKGDRLSDGSGVGNDGSLSFLDYKLRCGLDGKSLSFVDCNAALLIW
jgi:hypothetical protein